MKKVAPYIIILWIAVIALWYKSELKLWRTNYDELMRQYNSQKVTQWEKIPGGVTEYRIDTVFTFWDSKDRNIVPGKQTFKVK